MMKKLMMMVVAAVVAAAAMADDASDPRKIDTTDEAKVREDFDELNLKSDVYAKDGVVTVSFVEAVTGGTVKLLKQIDLTGFTYGLGRSESPAEPFVVEEGGWVQADEKGELPQALTAPKSGANGFYRVIVK